MDLYLNKFEFQLKTLIKNINLNIPEGFIYLGFIGYKDLYDKDLGDEYIDEGFTANHELIEKVIKDIQPDGGKDIPEDIAGAFKLGLNKKWEGKVKIAILFTDSPCHGRKYHDLNQTLPDEKDDRIDDNENNNIEDLIKKFVEKNISLFCVELHNNTNKMFHIFEDIYNGAKINNENCEFCVVKKNICDPKIIRKITELYNKIMINE